MPARVLVVDDEKAIADLVTICLENENYTVEACACGRDALASIEAAPPDLAILDVMLPDIDGFTLCQKIREKHLFPILMLTARVEDMDKIMGLTLGADDYITKPFVPLEAVARVKSNLRRFYALGGGEDRASEETALQVGNLRLETDACLLYRAGEKIELTSVEFRIMKLLMENPGRVFTKQQIFEAGWGETYMVSDNNVMVCISKLRAKLDCDGRNYISTIRGLGYRLEKE